MRRAFAALARRSCNMTDANSTQAQPAARRFLRWGRFIASLVRVDRMPQPEGGAMRAARVRLNVLGTIAILLLATVLAILGGVFAITTRNVSLHAEIGEMTEQIAELRGRLTALEDFATRSADTIQNMATMIPRQPAQGELGALLNDKTAALLRDGVALPIAESSVSGAQRPIIALVDPRCPYCQRGHGALLELVRTGNAHVVFLPVGVLGAESRAAAIAVLQAAAVTPALGRAVLDGMYTRAQAVDEKEIGEAVSSALAAHGIERSMFDARKEDGERALQRTQEIYEALGGPGVPVYGSVDAKGRAYGAVGFRDIATFRAALGL